MLSSNKHKHNEKYLICKQRRAESKNDIGLPSSEAMLQVKQSKCESCAVMSRAPRAVNENTRLH